MPTITVKYGYAEAAIQVAADTPLLQLASVLVADPDYIAAFSQFGKPTQAVVTVASSEEELTLEQLVAETEDDCKMEDLGDLRLVFSSPELADIELPVVGSDHSAMGVLKLQPTASAAEVKTALEAQFEAVEVAESCLDAGAP